jgi:hypothetical protein
MEASVKLMLIAKHFEFLTFQYKSLLLIEILKGSSQKKMLYGWNEIPAIPNIVKCLTE